MFGLLVKELEKPEVEAEDEEQDIQSDGEVVFSNLFELFGVKISICVKSHQKSPM